MIFRILFVAILLLTLTACSGGSRVVSSSSGVSSAQNPGPIDPSSLPISGDASYSGTFNLNLPRAGLDRKIYTGNLGLAVTFRNAGGQLSGEATKFRDPIGTAIDGRILIENGTLNRDTNVSIDYTFEAQVSGTLNGDGLRHATVFGNMSGDFVNGDDVSGVTSGGVTTATGVDVFDGSFEASKN